MGQPLSSRLDNGAILDHLGDSRRGRGEPFEGAPSQRMGTMLPTHGRYEYSNITTRPDYSWPGGKRLAVYLALNIEAFGFGVGKGAAIAEVTATIAKHEGAPPIGWMSPWLSNSAVTMDLLQEAGYRYVMDWTMDDQPIWIRTRKGRLLAMPYPIEVNDTRGIIWYHYTSDEFAEMIVDQFDELLAQSARQPLVCPISLHPFVIGRPYRLRRLRRALQHILAYRERIWLTRPRDIYAHVASLPAGVVPGSR